MIVPEDFAKNRLAAYGLRVPEGSVAATSEDAHACARQLGGAIVVKAVVPTGGRGKAGGVKKCLDAEEARQAAAGLLGTELLGHRVDKVLVERSMPVKHELYAACLSNYDTASIELLIGLDGGVDIESQGKAEKSGVMRFPIEPGEMVPAHRIGGWLSKAAGRDFDSTEVAHTLAMLHRAAADLDAVLLEVNPLAVLEDGSLAVLDCKLEVDDNSLTRNADIQALYLDTLSPQELRARELGVSYVRLEGNVGVITSGAGLGMATLDLLKRVGLLPANFLDTGGGISAGLVQGSLELIMEPKEVQGAIINLYGGINRMLEAATGIREALRSIGGSRPVVVKILGNQQEEAWEMLDPEPSVYVVRTVQTEQAVSKLEALLGGGAK